MKNKQELAKTLEVSAALMGIEDATVSLWLIKHHVDFDLFVIESPEGGDEGKCRS
jgi:hypothetical protein